MLLLRSLGVQGQGSPNTHPFLPPRPGRHSLTGIRQDYSHCARGPCLCLHHKTARASGYPATIFHRLTPTWHHRVQLDPTSQFSTTPETLPHCALMLHPQLDPSILNLFPKLCLIFSDGSQALLCGPLSQRQQGQSLSALAPSLEVNKVSSLRLLGTTSRQLSPSSLKAESYVIRLHHPPSFIVANTHQQFQIAPLHFLMILAPGSLSFSPMTILVSQCGNVHRHINEALALVLSSPWTPLPTI